MNVYGLVVKISDLMSTSKTSTDLCAIKQSVKLKNTFVDGLCSVLVVKKLWRRIKKFKL